MSANLPIRSKAEYEAAGAHAHGAPEGACANNDAEGARAARRKRPPLRVVARPAPDGDEIDLDAWCEIYVAVVWRIMETRRGEQSGSGEVPNREAEPKRRERV